MSKIPQEKPQYDKPWLSWSNQLDLLRDRGLDIPDAKDAEGFLSHVNYYRFSGYFPSFCRGRLKFVEGTTFEQIKKTYEFDCRLRDLVTEGLEYIEIDIRSTTAYWYAKEHGPFGHKDEFNFYQPKASNHTAKKKGRFEHSKLLRDIRRESKRSTEPFVKHFKVNYSHHPDLPIWVATEVMSFGCVSRMYQGMHKPVRKAIANRYGIQPAQLESWLHHLVYVRNICAHHCRMWDREWHIRPNRPYGKNWQHDSIQYTNRLFITLLIIYQLKKKCTGIAPAESSWRASVHALLREPPPISNALDIMGLPSEWMAHPLWA